MYISKIILNNIRSYVNQTIYFNSGINVLYGNIGSGKSTILQAIEIALFGLKKGDGNHILRKGEKEGFIQITFESGNNSITLDRAFKRTKQGITQSSGFVQINSSPLQELSTQEQNAFIFNYFQFPLSFINKDKTLMYRFTYYTPQEQLKEILTIQSDKRLDILRKVFNIDNYKQLQHAYSLSSKQLSKEIIIYETKYGELPEDLEKKITKYSQLIENYNATIKELNLKESEINQKLKKVYSNKQTLEEKRATVKEQVKTSKSLHEQLQIIENDLKTHGTKLNELNNKYSLSKSKLNEKSQFIEEITKQIDKLKTNIKPNENNYQELQKIQDMITAIERQIFKQEFITSLQSQINSYHHTIVKYKCRAQDIIVAQKKEVKLIKRRDKISKELEAYEEDKAKLSKQLIEFEAQVTSLREQVSQVINISTDSNNNYTVSNKLSSSHKLENMEENNNLNSILCPLCHQPIDNSHIQHLQEKLYKMEREYSETQLHKQLNDSNKIIEEKQEKQNSINEEIKQFEKEQYKLESINQTISQYREEQDKIKQELDNKQRDLEYSVDKNSNYYSKTVEELNEELKLLYDKKKNLENAIKQNEEQTKYIETLENQKKEADKSIQSIEKEQYEITTQINSLNEKRDEVNIRKKEIEDEIKKLEKSIEVNNKIDENIKRQEEIETKLTNKRNSIIKEKSDNETSIRFTTSQMREFEEQLKKKQMLKTNIEMIQEQKNFLSKEMSDMCQIIEETLFIELLSDVSQALRTYFIQLIEEQDIDVYLRDDFSLIIEQNGYEVDVEQLSGGEKSALALSYRLALKEVIERHFKHTTILDFIILDEPTDGFSQTQVQKFSSILQHANFKQAFLVSHDPSLSTAGEYVYVVEKEHHTSSIELQ